MAICLAPALWIARLTRDDRLPKRRAMFHVLGWGGYMMLVIPSVALSSTGKAMTDLYRLPVSITDWSLLAAGLLLLSSASLRRPNSRASAKARQFRSILPSASSSAGPTLW